MLGCGYQGSGKDSLCDSLRGKNHHQWYIYAAKSTKTYDFIPDKRQGFADIIKKRVHERLGCSTDLDKNTAVVEDPQTKQSKILRQWYIDYGAEMRAQDPDYFARHVPFDSKTMVTDFRFPNEHKFLKHKLQSTIRVFRAEVKLPTVHSEVQLDDFLTDYVALARHEDFEALVKHFPQYQGFAPQVKVCLGKIYPLSDSKPV